MQNTWGIIGFGNMGSAIARGLASSNNCSISILTRSDKQLEDISSIGAKHFTNSNYKDFFKSSKYIILAVKPYQIKELLEEINEFLEDNIIISVAASVTISMLNSYVGHKVPVVRGMPNTLVSVNSGSFALSFDKVNKLDKDLIINTLSSLGTVFELPESKINAFSALAGCGPAFVYYCAEAFVEAGVTLGFSRHQAKDIVVSLLSGCGSMAALTNKHLSILREEVTSPGGMTIAGTNSLDTEAARSALCKAILTSYNRGLEMEKD